MMKMRIFIGILERMIISLIIQNFGIFSKQVGLLTGIVSNSTL